MSRARRSGWSVSQGSFHEYCEGKEHLGATALGRFQRLNVVRGDGVSRTHDDPGDKSQATVRCPLRDEEPSQTVLIFAPHGSDVALT